MSKPYTETLFSEQITEDRIWRRKEISDLKSAIKRGDASLQRVLLRALVAICYAHWEGYVKYSAKMYLQFVALRRHQYTTLNRQFLRNHFLPRLAALSTSKTSIAERCSLIDEILNAGSNRFSRVNDDLVNTKSNLSSDVFADICIVCDIDVELFADKSDFIDIFLLRRRNAIAHGDDTFVTVGDLDEIANKTLDLMVSFGLELENHVALQAYKSV